MRFNKAKFNTTGLLLLSLVATGFWANSACADSISKVNFKNGGEKSQSAEGRQIAVSIPGLGEAKIIVTPKDEAPKSSGKPKNGRTEPLINAGLTPGHNISVKVPRSMDEFVDDVDGLRRQVSRTAVGIWTEASRLFHWVFLQVKQYFSHPTMTPGGYPYIEQNQPGQLSAGARLHFTREGRLKTVVAR